MNTTILNYTIQSAINQSSDYPGLLKTLTADLSHALLSRVHILDGKGTLISSASSLHTHSSTHDPPLITFPLALYHNPPGKLEIYRKEPLTEDELQLALLISSYMNLILLGIEYSRPKIADVKAAIGVLSYSELEAIIHVFSEIESEETLLVASKIAEKHSLSRSAIVNGLRKLESAGLIESRSLGMKGTYIKVLNEQLSTELDKFNRRDSNG